MATQFKIHLVFYIGRLTAVVILFISDVGGGILGFIFVVLCLKHCCCRSNDDSSQVNINYFLAGKCSIKKINWVNCPRVDIFFKQLRFRLDYFSFRSLWELMVSSPLFLLDMISLSTIIFMSAYLNTLFPFFNTCLALKFHAVLKNICIYVYIFPVCMLCFGRGL